MNSTTRSDVESRFREEYGFNSDVTSWDYRDKEPFTTTHITARDHAEHPIVIIVAPPRPADSWKPLKRPILNFHRLLLPSKHTTDHTQHPAPSTRTTFAMPLRTRIKRAFTFGSQDEDNLSKTSSKSSKRVDPNVYQPGEKMPPLKYRRPVNPEHKAKLESFSWQKAWRRRSEQSLYSPMGSRMPSRKNSKSTLGRRSFQSRRSARSISERKSLRGNDGIGVDSGFGGSIDGDLDPRRLARHKEDSDDEGDVLNGKSEISILCSHRDTGVQNQEPTQLEPYQPELLTTFEIY